MSKEFWAAAPAQLYFGCWRQWAIKVRLCIRVDCHRYFYQDWGIPLGLCVVPLRFGRGGGILHLCRKQWETNWLPSMGESRDVSDRVLLDLMPVHGWPSVICNVHALGWWPTYGAGPPDLTQCQWRPIPAFWWYLSAVLSYCRLLFYTFCIHLIHSRFSHLNFSIWFSSHFQPDSYMTDMFCSLENEWESWKYVQT